LPAAIPLNIYFPIKREQGFQGKEHMPHVACLPEFAPHCYKKIVLTANCFRPNLDLTMDNHPPLEHLDADIPDKDGLSAAQSESEAKVFSTGIYISQPKMEAKSSTQLLKSQITLPGIDLVHCCSSVR